jgi:hypothetical protein
MMDTLPGQICSSSGEYRPAVKAPPPKYTQLQGMPSTGPQWATHAVVNNHLRDVGWQSLNQAHAGPATAQNDNSGPCCCLAQGAGCCWGNCRWLPCSSVPGEFIKPL